MIADPGGVYPSPDTTLEKKADMDPFLEKKPDMEPFLEKKPDMDPFLEKKPDIDPFDKKTRIWILLTRKTEYESYHKRPGSDL